VNRITVCTFANIDEIMFNLSNWQLEDGPESSVY
jgi:hypothetical protein